MRSARERLLDVIEAAEQVAKYAVLGEERFRSDELIQVWILHHLQIAGEAVAALPPEVRERMPAVPWSKVVGMRNILVHQYFGIDLAVVWRAASHDLPALKAAAQELVEHVE
jgi:uncharacterized protein with HEPN domain